MTDGELAVIEAKKAVYASLLAEVLSLQLKGSKPEQIIESLKQALEERSK